MSLCSYELHPGGNSWQTGTFARPKLRLLRIFVLITLRGCLAVLPMLLTTLFLFLGNPRTIIFIIFVLVLFFGAKRIPELFRGVGQGVREFKDATNNVEQPSNPNYNQQPGYNQQGYPNQQNQAYHNQQDYPQQPQQYNQPQPGQIPPAPYNNPTNTPAS